MPNKKKYYIEVTDTQLEVIAEALDMHSRHLSGQLEYSLFPRSLENWMHKNKISGGRFNPDIEYHLNGLKKLLYKLGPGESLGVFQKKLAVEGAKSYDIYKAIMHEFEMEKKAKTPKKKYSSNVHTNEPLRADKTEPEVIVKKISKGFKPTKHERFIL